MDAAKQIALVSDAIVARLTGVVQPGEYKRRTEAAIGVVKTLSRAVLTVGNFDDLIADLRQCLFIYTVPKTPDRAAAPCEPDCRFHGAGNNPGLTCHGTPKCQRCCSAYACEHLTVETPAVSMSDLVSSAAKGGEA
jgi:hypothetical protein